MTTNDIVKYDFDKVTGCGYLAGTLVSLACTSRFCRGVKIRHATLCESGFLHKSSTLPLRRKFGCDWALARNRTHRFSIIKFVGHIQMSISQTTS